MIKHLCIIFSIILLGVSGSVPALAQEEGGEVLDEGKLKVSFEPFHISVMKRGRVLGTADVTLVLQLTDNRDYDELTSLKPALRSDISIALSSLARQRWDIARPIDPDIIKLYLTPYIEHRIGPGRVELYVLKALINPV